MRHVERAKSGTLSPVSAKMPSANSSRVTTVGGRIVMTYDSALPDSVKNAINLAKEMWESRLTSRLPIYPYIRKYQSDKKAKSLMHKRHQ